MPPRRSSAASSKLPSLPPKSSRPTGRYRFRTYDLRGGVIDTELRLVDGGMEWGLRNEERKADLRFTIRLDGDRWHEVGEVSVDGGETWYQMLEMTLERQAVATRSSP